MKKILFTVIVLTLCAGVACAADGDMIINGNVGIGTSSPAQKLSVAGTIESTIGGFKLPDGSTFTGTSSVIVYQANQFCGGYLTTSSTCATVVCRQGDNDTTYTAYYRCDGSCTDAAYASSCSNTALGRLVK